MTVDSINVYVRGDSMVAGIKANAALRVGHMHRMVDGSYYSARSITVPYGWVLVVTDLDGRKVAVDRALTFKLARERIKDMVERFYNKPAVFHGQAFSVEQELLSNA